MKSRFDIADFEESLKDYADNFTMVPSKRVWKGIYNDLHPGSKWPSLGIGLGFIIAILWVGFSSDNSPYRSPAPAAPDQQEYKIQSERISAPKSDATQNIQPAHQQTAIQFPPVIIRDYMPDQEIVVINDQPFVKQEITAEDNQNQPNTTIIVADHFEFNPKMELLRDPEVLRIQRYISTTPKAPSAVIKDNRTQNTHHHGNNELSAQNKLKKKKSQDKVSWNFFVTPSVSSVYFTGHNLQEHQNSFAPGVVVRPAPTKHSMTTNARIGIQLGGDIQYTFSDKFKLFSGMRLSYAGYNILTSYVHPTLADLTLQKNNGSFFTRSYLTYYGEGSSFGDVVLHNYSVQFAIPVGMQWQVWANEDVTLSIAPSIEPFVVLKDQAYILSSNGRNFIQDPDLMRSLNLNGNLGTFIRFSARNIDWKIGPTVQYQFLSSYKNVYPVKEHLLHYGLSIGISK